jgi:ferredoxin
LDNNKCIQCDVCLSKCPVDALTLKDININWIFEYFNFNWFNI